MNKQNKDKVFPIRMPEKQYNLFKKIAEQRKENRSVLIRQWIDDYISKHKAKNKMS